MNNPNHKPYLYRANQTYISRKPSKVSKKKQKEFLTKLYALCRRYSASISSVDEMVEITFGEIHTRHRVNNIP